MVTVTRKRLKRDPPHEYETNTFVLLPCSSIPTIGFNTKKVQKGHVTLKWYVSSLVFYRIVRKLSWLFGDMQLGFGRSTTIPTDVGAILSWGKRYSVSPCPTAVFVPTAGVESLLIWIQIYRRCCRPRSLTRCNGGIARLAWQAESRRHPPVGAGQQIRSAQQAVRRRVDWADGSQVHLASRSKLLWNQCKGGDESGCRVALVDCAGESVIIIRPTEMIGCLILFNDFMSDDPCISFFSFHVKTHAAIPARQRWRFSFSLGHLFCSPCALIWLFWSSGISSCFSVLVSGVYCSNCTIFVVNSEIETNQRRNRTLS